MNLSKHKDLGVTETKYHLLCVTTESTAVFTSETTCVKFIESEFHKRTTKNISISSRVTGRVFGPIFRTHPGGTQGRVLPPSDPEEFFLEVLRHVRSSLPHLWDQVARETLLTNLVASSAGSTVPPPPKAHPKTAPRRRANTGTPTHQVVVNVVNTGSTEQQQPQ